MNLTEEDKRIQKECLESLLFFTKVFYKIRTGRDFVVSNPIGRISHTIEICRALTKVIQGKSKRLIINIPPRYGKTELVISFISWALAGFPDSNFLYVSYSSTLSDKQTATVKENLMLPAYRKLFDVKISSHTSAKADFMTTDGGSVFAAGAKGTITGRGAGIQNCNRFGGAIVIDDIIKPDEVTSDSIREGIIEWYDNTLTSRVNSPDTPIIYIGQRLHESELCAELIESGDWDTLIIPALDEAGNALNPVMHTKEQLKKLQEKNPYVFAGQYMQNPVPAGGGIFQKEWFWIPYEEPEMIATFITADTAETDKDYNDATVFSFFGLYEIKNSEFLTGEYGLHWIDCKEIRIEPCDLEANLKDFYFKCMMYKTPPKFIAIEKKSTGVMLFSILNKLRGLNIIGVNRTKASGSKTTRYNEMTDYISQNYVSLPRDGQHTTMCIEHMGKITANNSHAHDDIADTLYDGVKMALIDKVFINLCANSEQSTSKLDNIWKAQVRRDNLRRSLVCPEK